MSSASRSASSAGLGVVLADAVEERAGGGGGRQGVRVPLLARERLAGLLGRGAQRVGEPEPGLLGRQRGVLARLGSDRLDLAEPEAEQVGLLGALARGGHDLVELALGGLAAGGAGRRTSSAARPAASPPNRSSASRWARAWSSRCWSDWPCTATSGSATLGQRGRPAPRRRPRRPANGPRPTRCGPARRGRPRPRRRPPRPPRRTRPGRRPRTTPSTRAAFAPVRTAPLSARPPSSRPSAVTTMVLPAPVSPVITVSPGPSSSVDDSMTPERADPDLLKHRRPPGRPRRACDDARSTRASPRRAGRTWRPAGR